jgi:hypothetical protein
MLSALFLISYGVKPNSRLLEAGTKVSSSYVCLPILKKAIHVLLAVEGSEWPHKAGTKLVILFLYMLPSTLDSGSVIFSPSIFWAIFLSKLTNPKLNVTSQFMMN